MGFVSWMFKLYLFALCVSTRVSVGRFRRLVLSNDLDIQRTLHSLLDQDQQLNGTLQLLLSEVSSLKTKISELQTRITPLAKKHCETGQLTLRPNNCARGSSCNDTTTQVLFQTSFQQQPALTYAIANLVIIKDTNTKASVFHSGLTSSGFRLTLREWSDRYEYVDKVIVNWIACSV